MNPQILLLDEITANLDALTERQVLEALQAASQNRTVLSISHRLYEAQGGRLVVMRFSGFWPVGALLGFAAAGIGRRQ